MPDLGEGGVHHGDEDVDQEDDGDALVAGPHSVANKMRKLHRNLADLKILLPILGVHALVGLDIPLLSMVLVLTHLGVHTLVDAEHGHGRLGPVVAVAPGPRVIVTRVDYLSRRNSLTLMN